MNVDFLSDLEEEIAKALREANLSVPTSEQLRTQDKRSEELKLNILHYDIKNILLHFFTVKSRLIPVVTWNVHISDRLRDREEIQDIVYKLENGQNVNSLLSNKVRKLNQAKNSDQLRSEWGIYHLHFVESRSQELLFIYFSGNDAYLIDILGHENPDGTIVTWTNTDLIQVLHDNWPQVIEASIFQKNSRVPILTTGQRRTLRKNSANTTVVVSDGTEYLPLAGGFSSSKHPTSAVIQADYLLNEVLRLEEIVQSNIDVIKQALITNTPEPNLKLRLGNNFQPKIIESTHNTLVNLQ
ncbi:hypothetical protein [Pseudoalteromonas undina]|uniref:Uncharacterized protein n=1 Tax=Pseudoalteromonas undina TaxID=43660 RepID=A0ACC6QZ23_9GAMM